MYLENVFVDVCAGKCESSVARIVLACFCMLTRVTEHTGGPFGLSLACAGMPIEEVGIDIAADEVADELDNVNVLFPDPGVPLVAAAAGAAVLADTFVAEGEGLEFPVRLTINFPIMSAASSSCSRFSN